MPPEQIPNPLINFIPLFLIILIFYFLLFKPQRDKDKQRKAMIAQLKKNDQVTTVGGLHGTVVNVKETTVILRFDENVRIEVDKDAVSTVKKSAS